MIVATPNDDTWKELAAGRASTGVVFLRVRSVAFPERGWNDFLFTCLGAWISNAITMHGAGIEIDNTFFDGNFSFRTRRLDRLPLADAKISVSFLSSGRRVRRAPLVVLSLRKYSLELCVCARRLIAQAARRRLARADDVKMLVLAVEKLRVTADISSSELGNELRRNTPKRG